MTADPKTAARAECGNPRRYDRGECNWPRCGCPSETVNDRDCASELRAWLTTYSGLRVSKYDAESLVGFLVKSGWRKPLTTQGEARDLLERFRR